MVGTLTINESLILGGVRTFSKLKNPYVQFLTRHYYQLKDKDRAGQMIKTVTFEVPVIALSSVLGLGENWRMPKPTNELLETLNDIKFLISVFSQQASSLGLRRCHIVFSGTHKKILFTGSLHTAGLLNSGNFGLIFCYARKFVERI